MTDAVRELIEQLSEAVHKAYCENYLKRKGEPYWTGGDYSKLDEETKEIDRDTVRAVLAALESAQPVSGWQPIETAPKDEHILGIDMMHTIAEYAWIKQYKQWLPDVHGAGSPTHWMPLPEPPKEV